MTTDITGLSCRRAKSACRPSAAIVRRPTLRSRASHGRARPRSSHAAGRCGVVPRSSHGHWRRFAPTGTLTATLTATAVDSHPTGWSPCTSTPRGMDTDDLESTRWTPPAETFNPRVLGSNPSRLTTIPRSGPAFPELSGATLGRFDSYVDSHGGRIRLDVVRQED